MIDHKALNYSGAVNYNWGIRDDSGRQWNNLPRGEDRQHFCILGWTVDTQETRNQNSTFKMFF